MKPSRKIAKETGKSAGAGEDIPKSDSFFRTRKWFGLVSFLAVIHLLAVLAEPLRFFSQSPNRMASEEARWLRQSLAPYVDMMYLSHGYSFFAPEPGPAHLIEVQLDPHTVSDGQLATLSSAQESGGGPISFSERLPQVEVRGNSKSKWLVFPDRVSQWPRLLYHRFFMLSEFYNTVFALPVLEGVHFNPEEVEPFVVESWRVDRDVYERVQDSIRNSLRFHYPGYEVQLRRVEHALPSDQQVLGDRWRLTDPRLYNVLDEGDSVESNPGSAMQDDEMGERIAPMEVIRP